MCPRVTAPISIFTTISLRLLFAALGVALATSALGRSRFQHQVARHALDQEVNRLGMPGNDDVSDVKRLAQTPSAAVQLLIEQLRIVPRPERTIVGEASSPAEHVLSSIRALRYIVGGWDFCAPTKWKPGRTYEERIRKYWLHFNSESCVTFFAVWPSRDRTYIAPIDAQREIIAAWQHWYVREGESYSYKPLVNPETWQWIEGVDKIVPVGAKGPK